MVKTKITNGCNFCIISFVKKIEPVANIICSHMPKELHEHIIPIAALTEGRELDINVWKSTIKGPHVEILNI